MPERRHLKRLTRVWVEQPIYFVTLCTEGRRSLLENSGSFEILSDEWRQARERHGWAIGRFVIMPDHVHFFCRPELGAKTLPSFMQAWKQWTAKRLIANSSWTAPIWQPEFFDHLLRSSESYAEKWTYVWDNPVRAGLVQHPSDWPWSGEIEILHL